MAFTFGTTFVVYRFPLWPSGVFSVMCVDRELPREADIVERFAQKAPVVTPAPGTEPQRSLF